MTNQTWNARETSRALDSQPGLRSELGVGKLRRRIAASAAGDHGGAAIGLGDPFAEIFASIAAAQTPAFDPESPSESEPSARSSEPAGSDAQNAEEKPDSHTETAPTQETSQQTFFPSVSEDVPTETAELTEQPKHAADLALPEPSSDDDIVVTEQKTTHEGDEQTNPTPVVKPNHQDEESRLNTELLGGVSRNRKLDRSDSSPVNPETPTDRSEPAMPVAAQANPKEEKNTTEQPHEQAPGDQRETQPNSQVERRRYRNHSEQPTNGNEAPGSENRSQADANAASKPQNTEAEMSSHTRASTGRNGVDISGMSATPTSIPLSTAAAAAVAHAASSNGSVSAATPLSGKAAPPSGVVNSNAASDSSSAPSAFGLEGSGKPARDSKTRASQPNAAADTTAAVQRAKLAQRVSRGFQHLSSGGGQIRMRLSPDHLGSVQLQMSIHGGKLNGRMVTQSEEATQMLRDQLPGLRATLESQGIRIERIEIQTDTANANGHFDGRPSSDAQDGFAGQQFTGQRNDADAQGGWARSAPNAARRKRTDSVSQAVAAPVPTGNLSILPGSVDLQV